MHTPLLRLVVSTIAVATSLQTAAAAGVSFTIEQKSSVQAPASWTLLTPNQEKIQRNDWKFSSQEQPVGNYTLFITPPKGTNASITLSENGTVLQTVNHQISFTAQEGQNLHINIESNLVNKGKVSVNSAPLGIPFQIYGPNNWTERGVTPASFEQQPIGDYSVQYSPDGCPTPNKKSDKLIKDGRIDFFFELSCATFKPIEAEQDTHLKTDFGPNTISFTDVPLDAWYTPFVETAVRRGILSGYKDERGNFTNTFGPSNPMTLAELAKIAHQLADVSEQEFSKAPDNTQAMGTWFNRYIASAEERGWLVYQDSTLDLNRPATRGEVMVTFLQVLDVPMQWAKGNQFKDVSRRTKYSSAIETATTLGFVAGSTNSSGESTGFFYPENPITRAEVARILINVHEKMKPAATDEDR